MSHLNESDATPAALPHDGMTIELARQLAVALNVPLFSTDLHMPAYALGSVGRWRLVRGEFTLDHGYHSGAWAVWGMPALLRDSHGDGKTWETWMSLSPHEIESQELGCRHARGHTAVMGLGMGWVAVNIALNPAVRYVSVVERDPEVIALFAESQVLRGLPAEIAAKIRIVQADALEWRPGEAVDFLYADIWRCLEEPQTLDDVRRMQANVAAGSIYFWGQELFIHALAERAPQDADAPAEALRRCVAERIALPLLLPASPDYPAFINRVVSRRRRRWLGGNVDARGPRREPERTDGINIKVSC